MNKLLKNWNNNAQYSWSDGLQTESSHNTLDKLNTAEAFTDILLFNRDMETTMDNVGQRQKAPVKRSMYNSSMLTQDKFKCYFRALTYIIHVFFSDRQNNYATLIQAH